MTAPPGPEDAYPKDPPSFVPGSGQGAPYQGQPDPPQPNDGSPEPGTPPMASAPSSGESDRVPARYGYLAIGAVILVAVIGIGLAVWSISWAPKTSPAAIWTYDPTTSASKAPSGTASARAPTDASATGSASAVDGATASDQPSITKQLPTCIPGHKIVTDGWSATVPSGWTCVSGSTTQSTTQLILANSNEELIALSVSPSKDAASACGADLARQVTSLTPLPDTVWGGRTATTATIVTARSEAQARCVQANGIVYTLVGDPTQGGHGTVIAVMDALTAGWVWS